jgi:hypothetical protein
MSCWEYLGGETGRWPFYFINVNSYQIKKMKTQNCEIGHLLFDV